MYRFNIHTAVKAGLAMLVLSCGAKTMFADVVVSPSGEWYSGYTTNQSGGQFFSQKSSDGNDCNIGYWLDSGTWAGSPLSHCKYNPDFVGGGAGTDLPFLANTAGSNLPVGWELKTSGVNSVTLKLEDAGNADTNESGIYFVNPTGTPLYAGDTLVASPQLGETIERHNLFSGPSSAGTSQDVTLPAGTQFGFYLCPNGSCGNSSVEYSGEAYSASGAYAGRSGKFALFSETPVMPGAVTSSNSSIYDFWVGIEDGSTGNGVEKFGDYNDMLLHVSVVPEPGFYGVLGLGLAGLFIAFARKRRTA